MKNYNYGSNPVLMSQKLEKHAMKKDNGESIFDLAN